MKKTLKLVGIFMAVLVVAIVGALGGYFLISKNKTYYIYDLRLVEPVQNARYYVYTDNEANYTSIKNKSVYMTSNSDNRFQIGVYAYTSTNTTEVEVTSSDPSVAKIVYYGGACYVEYLKAGVAEIKVSIASVTDSFMLYVYNEIADSFRVFDNKYYGNFSKHFPNKIISYSDMIEYSYDYVAVGSAGESSGDINNSLIRIDDTKINKDVFDKVYINSADKKLVVKCKAGLPETVDETIVIQSYYIDDNSNIKISQNYYVDVHIVAYTPEFLQVELATTPDFEDAYIFMNTNVINEANLTDDVVQNNTAILEEFLSYQKAERNLESRGEASVYDVLFTNKVTKIYLKFRKVYTNGDVVYLNPLSSEKNPFELNFGSDNLVLSANKEYYTLTLLNDYFTSHNSFDIKLTLSDYDLNFTFKFKFAALTAENIAKFYSYDRETGYFKYIYWDPRTHFENEMYDEMGNIIGFGDLSVDLSVFETV